MTPAGTSWSELDQAPAVRINAGEWHVSVSGEVIITVLGSCVSACIADPARALAGMNHFMLPGDAVADEVSGPARWGAFAMEVVLNELLARGAERRRLVAKLFGGSELWGAHHRVGTRNVEFARSYLSREGIQVVAEDVGGERPRRVHFRTREQIVRVKRLPALEIASVVASERRHVTALESGIPSGEMELF